MHPFQLEHEVAYRRGRLAPGAHTAAPRHASRPPAAATAVRLRAGLALVRLGLVVAGPLTVPVVVDVTPCPSG
jgi:hypothetical protein